MKLFVGLGNPGADYALHRHNVGFMALDRLAAAHGFGPWRRGTKALVSEGRLGAEKVILLKPQTFMNASGEAVQAALAFYKLPLADVMVFHDELDLAPFRLRVKQGGGHAGHNGLRSIHGHLGEFYGRVRIGIGHPGHKDAVAGYVLHTFAKAEAEGLDNLLRGISDGAEALAAGDAAGFMNAVALRTVPQRSGTGDSAPASKSAPARSDQAPAATAADPAPAPAKPLAPRSDAAPPLSALQRLAARFRG